ncbi:MAG: glycine zipper 2TM domain-containing protein, partial [Leptothrix sp. (in: b-proteobacteria)]
VGVVADAGTAGGGSSNAKPWMLAAGALVVGVTAAAAVAWHSASADAETPEQGMTTSAAKSNPSAKNTAQLAHKQAEPARQHAAVQTQACHQCGTVESVQAVTHKGEGSGLGAVAGGVVGGALGSQVGKGDGRTAMTVLGAIGGGLAGNEVEKRAKSVTHYRVTLKMEDGSVQTIEQAQPPAVGQRVRVEGQTLQPLPRQG